jgi:hypothetical protein
MEEAALLERIEGEDEPHYRQTLNAAVEMSLNFERQAFYLMPAEDGKKLAVEDTVVGLIEGDNGPRSSGEFATAFPDEDIDEDADTEQHPQRLLNGGVDVGH